VQRLRATPYLITVASEGILSSMLWIEILLSRAVICRGAVFLFEHPDKILKTKPDYILILPWNIKDEIIAQLSFVRDWGCKFIIPIPELKVV